MDLVTQARRLSSDKLPYEAASMTILQFDKSNDVITDSADNNSGGGTYWSDTSTNSLDEDLLINP